ncbi:MAG: thiamine pyrophosphate-dependent enzyme [Candidatus Firestonebacteria bacterium]
MKKIFKRPESLTQTSTIYCPGCGHGIVHRLIAECIDELKMREKTIGVAPVGCAVYAYDFFNFDVTEAAHGRTPVVATAIKRVHPENLVFSYQGDGDLASIGMAEIVHCANRGENITVIFINNANYGMTGGQMAPTTLVGQKTTTTPFGRNANGDGYPIKVCELLATLKGAVYLERVSVTNPGNVRKTKKAILKGFKTQIQKSGFSLIEVLSPCPINWGMTPLDAIKWIDEKMVKEFPIGVIKEETHPNPPLSGRERTF